VSCKSSVSRSSCRVSSRAVRQARHNVNVSSRVVSRRDEPSGILAYCRTHAPIVGVMLQVPRDVKQVATTAKSTLVRTVDRDRLKWRLHNDVETPTTYVPIGRS